MNIASTDADFALEAGAHNDADAKYSVAVLNDSAGSGIHQGTAQRRCSPVLTLASSLFVGFSYAEYAAAPDATPQVSHGYTRRLRGAADASKLICSLYVKDLCADIAREMATLRQPPRGRVGGGGRHHVQSRAKLHRARTQDRGEKDGEGRKRGAGRPRCRRQGQRSVEFRRQNVLGCHTCKSGDTFMRTQTAHTLPGLRACTLVCFVGSQDWTHQFTPRALMT